MEGVPKCFVFKSRLQEYAQKVGLTTPVYETVKEGPSHEPLFNSTVIIDQKRFSSLPGFTSRKAAEQSAAEIALLELSNSGLMKETISSPVHEIGLCKNLLQEYSIKMNFAIPVYTCQHFETPGKPTCFTCTVDIGGMKYVGGMANTKKEAEIKAARTALLAIRITCVPVDTTPSQLTVIPPERIKVEKTPKKRGSRKKKPWRKQKRVKATVVDGEVLKVKAAAVDGEVLKVKAAAADGEASKVKAVSVDGDVSDNCMNRPESSQVNIMDDQHSQKGNDMFLRPCVEGHSNSVKNELPAANAGI